MKYYNIKSLLIAAALTSSFAFTMTSCKEWLDKDPESVVAEDEAFKNYRNFQGYIEEIYSLIPNKANANYCSAWNFGDDAVHNVGGYAHMDHQVDLGNYRNLWNSNQCWINGARYTLWKSGWYSIRKCNMGIENIKSLVGTDEERDLLLGQLYFFRAWWHFEMMCYFGGLPYIDVAFDSEIPQLPRLSFQECADRCAEDFEKAYSLLPLDWDETLAGMQSSGKNDLRINKYMALCYLGKCYLWAGSPLMKEFEKTKDGGQAQLTGASTNGKTYDYDLNYISKAAETLGRAVDMANRGQIQYSLADYRYDNIYDHTKSEGSESNYSDLFYSHGNWDMPGSCEAIFRGCCPDRYLAKWRYAETFGPKVAGIVDGDNVIQHPTGNLVDQYGMANGQPIYLVEKGQLVFNRDSGWDPKQPYKNRDPRFYHDIVFDGFHYVINVEKLSSDDQKALEYCPLYTGGAERDIDHASSTGYFIQKLVPHQCNEGDKWYDDAMMCYIPYMRLADIYLMYAEAQGVIGGAKSKASTCTMTAVDAINKLRDRVSSDEFPLEHVATQFMATKELFIDEVRRERAVELAFEGFRWCDLQRWLLLTEPPYTLKYSHEFNRVEKDDWYKQGNDPKEARVDNFRREDLIKRPLTARHYWFPLPDKDTYLYEGFVQNPGW